MLNAAEAFDENRGKNLFRSISDRSTSADEARLPWSKVREGELPPMMFQLRLQDGQTFSYAYSDLRVIRGRDAGHVELGIASMSHVQVTLEGRHLRELAGLLGSASIRWVEESDARDVGRPEKAPEVVKITIETLEP